MVSTLPRPAPADALLTAPVWRVLARTDDLDAHARAQRDWTLHYEQLSDGRFEGLVHQIQLPLARLVHEHCNVAVRQRGRFVDGTYGFALALRPEGGGCSEHVASTEGEARTQSGRQAEGGEAIFNGQRVAPDAVMLGRNGPGGELDLRTPPDHGLIAIVVDAALLEPLWQQMYGKPPSAWMQTHLVVPARPALAAALRQHHLQAMARAAALLQAMGTAWAPGGADQQRSALHLRDDLLIEWFEALPETVDASRAPHAVARKRLVDHACALMLDRRDEPPSMLTVCREVGASRRKLNYCFQEVLGLSPVKYLRAVRLNGARRELRGAGAASVQDAATRWGFWHLGQFAQDYRRQFGELPSHTLRTRAATGATTPAAAHTA